MPVLPPSFSRRVFFAFCMLFTMMAATLLLPPNDAWAAEKPKWLGVKIDSWEVITPKNADMNKTGSLILKVKIAHTNNSKDKVATALYDKKGWVEITGDAVTAQAVLTSTKVNRVNLDPGQSMTLVYNLPITKLKGHQDAIVNSRISRGWKSFKVSRWNYDLKVKSTGI